MSDKIYRLRVRAVQAQRLGHSISDLDAGRTLKLLGQQFEDEANRLEAELSERPENQDH